MNAQIQNDKSGFIGQHRGTLSAYTPAESDRFMYVESFMLGHDSTEK